MHYQAGPRAGQPAASAGGGVVRFGAFHLDPRSGELWNKGARQTLGEQPLAVLLALLGRPGQLVTREELKQRLWPRETFDDFEHGLNAAVKRLRDALNDSADTPSFIETIPRRGYRFIGTIDDAASTASLTSAAEQELAGLDSPEHQSRVRGLSRRLALTLAALVVVSAATWIAFQFVTLRHPPQTPEHQLTRLTDGLGLQIDPAWSPDGQYIAYAWDKSGNFDIWAQRLPDGQPIQLTHSPLQETNPDWSPDGKAIVFRREAREGGGLFVVPAYGGPERQLTAFGVRPRYSPDGTRILFVSTDRTGSFVTPNIFIIASSGGVPRQILKGFFDGRDDVENVVWHPDGRRISYLVTTRGANGAEELDTVSPDGGSVDVWKIKSVNGLLSFDVSAFEWDPSGAAVYITTAQQDKTDFWRVTKSREVPEQMTAERLTPVSAFHGHPVIARDGKRLAFSVLIESTRLWSFPIVPSGRVDEAHGRPITPSGVGAGQCDLARDGKTLSYVLVGPREDARTLWMMNLDGGAPRLLGDAEPGPDMVPRQRRALPHWSRDGRKLAYVYTRFDKRALQAPEAALAILRTDTGEEQLLTTPQHPTDFKLLLPMDWSPDGRAVLAASNLLTPTISLGLWPLSKAPHAETAATTLASDRDHNLWQGRFSPDGRWIAFLAQKFRDPGAGVLAVMPSSGAEASHWRVLTDPNGWADKPRWSEDGRLLYYVKAESGFYNVWALPFDTTRGTSTEPPIQITHFESQAFHLRPTLEYLEPAVSSTRLILLMQETAGNIWTIDSVRR